MLDIYPAAWNKIFKKKMIDKSKIVFKKGVWFEDVEFLYRLYPYIKSIGVVSESLINYVQRPGNITSTFDKRLYHYIYNWNGIIEYYKKKNLYEEYKLELEYCYVRYIYATFVKRAVNYHDKKMYNEAVEEAIEQVNKYFPKYRQNKYFYRNLKGIYLVLFNRTIARLLYVKGH